ncbi:MAG TPA: phosphoglycerate kinase [Candidatus Paceibacterota bacterium]|nr:phosphoglycerate kinase [Candidatus Paceibacterota bacterium]
MRTLSSFRPSSGTHVVVRVDFNVPLKGGVIVDDRRIKNAFPTIDLLLKKKTVPILVAHLEDGTKSLRPIARFLSRSYRVDFITGDIFDVHTTGRIAATRPGRVVLLENIRRYEGEKKNDPKFAKQLASLGDAYVDEAFSVAHRAHASIVGVPKLLPHYAGLAFAKEVKALTFTLRRPFFFILGGAKFETKVPLIEKFLKMADHVFIAGAIANSFFKASGFPVGKSVVDDGQDKSIKKFANNAKLLLPIDVVVVHGKKSRTCTLEEVKKDDIIVDIGPKTVALVIEKVKKAKLIVWNGPTGWYEKGFTGATKKIARAIESSKAHAIIGGGDTGAVIEKTLRKHSKHIFISTAGGAAIDFLAKGTLPGIEALND